MKVSDLLEMVDGDVNAEVMMTLPGEDRAYYAHATASRVIDGVAILMPFVDGQYRTIEPLSQPSGGVYMSEEEYNRIIDRAGGR